MGSDKRTANAVGGKTARACDSCVRRRASWYCAADDAFLCQACDISVHSANPLARRHHRLRLNVSSSHHEDPRLPTWVHGINTKPRTPRRHGKPKHTQLKPHSIQQTSHSSSIIVPQLDDRSNNFHCSEVEDELLYRVPMLEGAVNLGVDEFAADVETLLGKGLDGEIRYGIEELGLLDCREEDYFVPVKPGNEKEAFELTFDYNYYSAAEETTERVYCTESCGKVSLQLDYEGVRAAWASKGSPWMDGEKPEINIHDNFWTHLTMEDSGRGLESGERGVTKSGGGREARVWRYREKRRKRLFTKKIRYEVRKLNAEKRPRLKGRFVKTCS